MKALRFLPAAAALAGLVWLAWPRAGGRPDEELQAVSPHWEGIREEFGRAFAAHWKARTGRNVRISWLDLGGTSKCMRFVKSAPPGQAAADVLFGGGVDNHLELAGKGYLEAVALPPADLGHVPLELGGFPLRDAGDRWYAACLSSFGICYNREVLRRAGLPEPREWEDLADARFLNWVGSGNPDSSGVVHMCYEMVLQGYGWERGFALLTRMAGNVRAFDESGGGVPRDVAIGQFAAGGSIDFYALERVISLGSDSMGYAVPRRMPVINGDPVAVLRGAPNRAAAEGFVRFVMSEAGQRLWYLAPGQPGGPTEFALGRLPAWRELSAEASARLGMEDPYAMKGLGGWDSAKNGRRWGLLNGLLRAAAIEPHDELRRAWRALVAAGLPAEGLAEFGAPPCGEEEFMRLADWYNDRAVSAGDKNARVAEWGRWARDKYARVRKKYEGRAPGRAQ